ncbi:MAG: hypothetical protein ACJAR2_003666 [Ilumatobacter sp.]
MSLTEYVTDINMKARDSSALTTWVASPRRPKADLATYETLHRDRFDPRAGVAFYDDLASLPDHALDDDCPCPLYCFWGD